jgi:hypothetical protein
MSPGLKHQINSSFAGQIEICISSFADLIAKKANSEKLGLGIDNPCREVFFLVCG